VTPLPGPAPALRSRSIEPPAKAPVQAAPPVAPIEIVALKSASGAEKTPSLEQTPPIPLLDLAAIQARYPLLRNTL
jgi:hypothetical protein